MKIITALLFVFASLNSHSSNAQINISADSINNILCHKWGFKAIIMGGQRLTNMNETITYEFLIDGSLKRVTSNGKVENGTWRYKAEQKIISLKIKKIDLFIPILSNDELIILSGDGSPGKGTSVGTVLKPIDTNHD